MPCANEPVTALARPKETRTEMDIEMNRAELLTRFLLQRPAPAHRLMLAGLKPEDNKASEAKPAKKAPKKK